MNDFDDCLKQSHAAEDLPIWEDIYRKAFPAFACMINHRQDGEHQRAGIDRSVILSNSKQILVDEKVRGSNRRTGLVYEDIALEYVSNDQRNTPGWVCNPNIRADFIAYAILPLGKCYLLPVIQLQKAWDRNAHIWLSTHKKIKADNKFYFTLSCCVPPAELYRAIGNCLRIHFEPMADMPDPTKIEELEEECALPF